MLKKLLLIDYLKWLFSKAYEKTLRIAFYNQSDFLDEAADKDESLDLVQVISKAMEIAIKRRRENKDETPEIMLEPQVKHYGKMEFENLQKMYEEGRRVAEEALPRIKKLISEWSQQTRQPDIVEKQLTFKS